MKKIVIIVALVATTFGYSQAFQGKGDQKFQVGANFQDEAQKNRLSTVMYNLRLF